MPDWLTKIINIPKTLSMMKMLAFYLIIPAGAILFTPDTCLTAIRALDFESLDFWIEGIFLLSISIVIVEMFKFAGKVSIKIYSNLCTVRSRKKLIALLDDKELEIVYLVHKNGSHKFEGYNVSAYSLREKGIIICHYKEVDELATYKLHFPHALEDWVREYLKKTPSILLDFSEKAKSRIDADIRRLNENKSKHSAEIKKLEERRRIFE
jgi:hypothetical protein